MLPSATDVPVNLSPSDPELEQTAWDLEPLVDGQGQDGARTQLAEALERSQHFAAQLRGQAGRARQRRPRASDARVRRDPGAGRPRRHLCRAALLGRHRRSGSGCADAGGAGARHRDRDDLAVLRAGMGRARGRAGRGAARRRAAVVLCASPAQCAPLPRAPALRNQRRRSSRRSRSRGQPPGRACSTS